jgi:hypothetical protein
VIAKEVEQKRARRAGQVKSVLQDTLSAATDKVHMIKQQLANGQAIANKMK